MSKLRHIWLLQTRFSRGGPFSNAQAFTNRYEAFKKAEAIMDSPATISSKWEIVDEHLEPSRFTWEDGLTGWRITAEIIVYQEENPEWPNYIWVSVSSWKDVPGSHMINTHKNYRSLREQVDQAKDPRGWHKAPIWKESTRDYGESKRLSKIHTNQEGFMIETYRSELLGEWIEEHLNRTPQQDPTTDEDL